MSPARHGPWRSWLRSPYLWAFVAGVLTVTALRPMMRRVPDPPPVLGAAPAFRLEDRDGHRFGSAELAGEAYVLGFFSAGCRADCPRRLAAMRRLGQRYADEGIASVRLVAVRVGAPGSGEAEGPGERWNVLSADGESVRSLADAWASHAPMPAGTGVLAECDRALAGGLALVDAAGRARGVYDVLRRTDRFPGLEDAAEVGVDEVFHRSGRIK